LQELHFFNGIFFSICRQHFPLHFPLEEMDEYANLKAGADERRKIKKAKRTANFFIVIKLCKALAKVND